ncbi:tRNA uridine-5-carboxymethylaminomethyl(34) synthesis GTPase MnmE, partial [Candidatus Margulisiibacteriota bacterium]
MVLISTDFINDDIAAIATPAGVGGIGIIRISGPNSLKIIKNIFSKKTGFRANFLYHGQIINPTDNEKIDDACVIYFKNPYSYTGEDVVEIHAHSNPLILRNILALLSEFGVRLAGKGEFTKRAFVNGKIDLTKAEAVIDLIQAKSPKAISVALGHLDGGLYKKIKKIRDRLLSLLENLEAAIDFPDDITPMPKENFVKTIEEIDNKIQDILHFQDYGEMVFNGVKCLIIGKPNVGKSLLLNRLLGQNRAIVTSIPGTTRDFLDGEIELGSLLFQFTDTAGYRETTDQIEKEGLKKIPPLLKKANLILWVIDCSQELTEEDLSIYQKIKGKNNIWIVINKIDKKPKLNLKKNSF